MNALFELIGEAKYVTLKESETIADTPEYNIEFGIPVRFGPNKGHTKVFYHYKYSSYKAKEWVKKCSFC